MASRFAAPNMIGPVLDFMCEQGDRIFKKARLCGSVEVAIFQLTTRFEHSSQLPHMAERSSFHWLRDHHPDAIEPACKLFERYIKEHKESKAAQAAQEYLAAQQQNERINDAISSAFARGYCAYSLLNYAKPINADLLQKLGKGYAKGCQVSAEFFDEPIELGRTHNVFNDFIQGYAAASRNINQPIDEEQAYKIGCAYNLGSIDWRGSGAVAKYLERRFALDDEWRTAKPHGPDSKGQHYRINHKGGVITGGMGGKFNGLTENEAFGKKGRANAHRDNANSQPQKSSAANAIPQSLLVGSAKPQKAQPKTASANANAKAQPKNATANAKAQISAAARPTQEKSNSLTFSDLELLRVCLLPFAGQISDLVDQRALEQLKAQYRSGVNAKSIEGICNRREIRALLQLGPCQYANSDLKDYPGLDFEEFNIQGNNNELQSAFNLLQANAIAGNALRKLADAKLLELPEIMRTHIGQLNAQVAEVKRMYAINLCNDAALGLSEEVVSFKSAMAAITGQMPSTPALNKRGAELVLGKMVERYEAGGSVQVPWVKFCLTKPDFHCSSNFVALYVDTRKISALLSDNKDALNAYWGDYDYDIHQAMVAKLTYQTEKAIELLHNCTVDQALDREFSYYDIAHTETQQGGSYQPDDLDHALVVAPLCFREADSNKPNRHYGKIVYVRHVDAQGSVEVEECKPFNNNCSFCVSAYELRRRGVVVEAMAYFEPKELRAGLISWDNLPPQIRLELCSQSLWLNHATGAYPDVTYLCKVNKDFARVSNQEFPHKLEDLLNQLIEPGQRFHLAWKWLGNGGHIVDVEKNPNGELLIYDPQSGQYDSVSLYFDRLQNKLMHEINLSSMRTYRVDDCNCIDGLAQFAVAKFGRIEVESGNLITKDRSMQMATDSGQVFDDDIPDYVRRVCGNYEAEYCGEYKTKGKLWDVYSMAPYFPQSLYDLGFSPMKGYPQYLLLAKDGSDLVMMISDEDLEITCAVRKQLEQLRKEGHKRRPEQLWV